MGEMRSNDLPETVMNGEKGDFFINGTKTEYSIFDE